MLTLLLPNSSKFSPQCRVTTFVSCRNFYVITSPLPLIFPVLQNCRFLSVIYIGSLHYNFCLELEMENHHNNKYIHTILVLRFFMLLCSLEWNQSPISRSEIPYLLVLIKTCSCADKLLGDNRQEEDPCVVLFSNHLTEGFLVLLLPEKERKKKKTQENHPKVGVCACPLLMSWFKLVLSHSKDDEDDRGGLDWLLRTGPLECFSLLYCDEGIITIK